MTVNGDVTAGKTGILAGSVADADADNGFGLEIEEQGDITVSVNKGAVTGGSGYYGIAILGGDQNTVTIGKKASVTSRTALPSTARRATRRCTITASSMAMLI